MWAKFILKCAIEEEARLRLNSPPLKTTYTSNCANALTFPSPLGYSFSSCLSWSIPFLFWKWLLPFISSLDRPTRSWSSEGPWTSSLLQYFPWASGPVSFLPRQSFGHPHLGSLSCLGSRLKEYWRGETESIQSFESEKNIKLMPKVLSLYSCLIHLWPAHI